LQLELVEWWKQQAEIGLVEVVQVEAVPVEFVVG